MDLIRFNGLLSESSTGGDEGIFVTSSGHLLRIFWAYLGPQICHLEFIKIDIDNNINIHININIQINISYNMNINLNINIFININKYLYIYKYKY